MQMINHRIIILITFKISSNYIHQGPHILTWVREISIYIYQKQRRILPMINFCCQFYCFKQFIGFMCRKYSLICFVLICVYLFMHICEFYSFIVDSILFLRFVGNDIMNKYNTLNVHELNFISENQISLAHRQKPLVGECNRLCDTTMLKGIHLQPDRCLFCCRGRGR